jgi:cation transporter-like permease
MSESSSASPPGRRVLWSQPRIWHLLLLVLFVALAIADIRDQRVHEPVLVALALGGFALYATIGWMGWWVARRRLESRLGPVRVFAIYAVSMGALFLVATVVYLVIEYAYRNR